MSNIIIGAVALGLLWSVTTIGVFITYRILDIADLSVEGTIVLGASVAAVIIAGGGNPYLATAAAVFAGVAAGIVTGLLHTKLKIPALLSGILCMISLYSVNIRVMHGSANVSLLKKKTIYTVFMNMGFGKNVSAIIVGVICVALVVGFMYWFFRTEIGYAVRATGNSIRMASAQGINTDNAKILGLAMSNGLVGLSGAIIAQYLAFSDVQMGIGSIVIGLASLIIGEVLFSRKGMLGKLLSMVYGAIVYRIIIALVLAAGMEPTDLKLFTALTVAIALYAPHIRAAIDARSNKKPGENMLAAKGAVD